MKIAFLAVLISIWVSVMAGCGRVTEKSTAADNKNAAAPAAQKKEAEKSALKPGDLNPDKAVTVIDLVDAAVAEPGGWKGKQVVVTGYVYSTSNSNDHTLLGMSSGKEDTKKSVTCSVAGDVSDLFDKNVEVKGTIKFLPSASDESKTVNLEPCEVKK